MLRRGVVFLCNKLSANKMPQAEPPVEQSAAVQASALSEQKKVKDLKSKTQNLLFKAKTVFPFDFFPDMLIIDTLKVTVITKQFFGAGEVTSLYIKDVENVVLQTGPVFATIKIISNFLTQQPISIKPLKKQDAIKARNILHGLLITAKQQVDVSKIENPQIAEDMEKIGEVPAIDNSNPV